VEINMGLLLPRDGLSIPVARHICRFALHEVGVKPECIGDIEIALTEACTNVLDHSGPGEEYEVQFSMNDERCVIRIIDTGHGFDGESLGRTASDLSAERGRGIELMRALVDRVKFESKHEAGPVVHLEKELSFVGGSPVARLVTGRDEDGGR
jgi:serine/threonine-protein kinase RsbW